MRDHPRTRGVYVTGRRLITSGVGSSPHTRGLQENRWVVYGYRGIIPAHAGFTLILFPGALIISDHPRTRGVYRLSIPPAIVRAGSSPHTRGLLRPQWNEFENARIIPAHAGFTGVGGVGGLGVGDHPRTRGVYPLPDATTWPTSGSSPHTRGLQLHETPWISQGRIIPAHAGFTLGAPTCNWVTRDHPRTRGVYTTGRSRISISGGSSPHTRGLQRPGGRRRF